MVYKFKSQADADVTMLERNKSTNDYGQRCDFERRLLDGHKALGVSTNPAIALKTL
jgi:hypothetical protein